MTYTSVAPQETADDRTGASARSPAGSAIAGAG
eukprot:CAMPEP_0183581358 /NCGR_PEP_ID=MMETSP0371-20130417/147475_1 /TAXON_ID=268820 /ORGANISM="Peridinium aciculiferum, Strain PAER-2" /LENGTH=32 /DNA_ID= /DNA_START= /DNA_END= /DNA_ORIENTATION=